MVDRITNTNIKYVVFKLYCIYERNVCGGLEEFNKKFRGRRGRGWGEQSPVGALCRANRNALSHFTSYRLHLDANAGAWKMQKILSSVHSCPDQSPCATVVTRSPPLPFTPLLFRMRFNINAARRRLHVPQKSSFLSAAGKPRILRHLYENSRRRICILRPWSALLRASRQNAPSVAALELRELKI